VLIDEIDKADIDVPNGLLETLGNGTFSVPYIDQPIGLQEHTPSPLIIITTNEERVLPAAFVRRCLVHYLPLPEKEAELNAWLIARGKIHFNAMNDEVLQETAKQLYTDRLKAINNNLPKPGQAEYLDILRALDRLDSDKDKQLSILSKIKDFALKKNPATI
jgi:MoxR-like ATPase